MHDKLELILYKLPHKQGCTTPDGVNAHISVDDVESGQIDTSQSTKKLKIALKIGTYWYSGPRLDHLLRQEIELE